MQPNYELGEGSGEACRLAFLGAGTRCWLLACALDRAFCAAWIARLEQCGFGPMAGNYPPAYRDNDRVVLDDTELARQLFHALGAQLPGQLTDERGQRWVLAGLNPRFRACRYRSGQSFSVHRDGAYAPSDALRSQLTLQIYLNDSGEFSGGNTRFYASASGAVPLWSCQPQAGNVIVFAHDLWHDGEAVTAGTKYVLRSDVMYRRLAPELPARAAQASAASTGHRGYVWGIAKVSDDRLVSASRDGSLRSWRAPGAGELVQSAVSELGADAACALAASGKNVLTGDRRGQLALFEADGSRIVPRARRTDAHCGAVLCIRAFGGDFFSSGADGRVCRWQTDLHATQRLQLESGLWIWALSPGPEGVWLGDAGGRVSLTDLACASAPTRVQRFDAAVRALLPTARGGVWVALASGVLAQLSPRGELTWQARVSSGALLALSEDRLGNLWFGGESGQLSYLTPERTLQQVGAHRDFITSLLPLDDGRMVSSSYDAQVRIWPSAT